MSCKFRIKILDSPYNKLIESTAEYKLFCDGQGGLSNPYPFYSQLRDQSPVYFSETLQAWLISTYQDVKSATGDKRLSSNKMPFYLRPIGLESRDSLSSLQEYLSAWMSMKDGFDHMRLRTLVNKAFTSRSLDELSPRIQGIADQLIDDFTNYSPVNLIEKFAYPFPATVICEMLGIPTSEQSQFRKWANDIVSFSAGSTTVLEKAAKNAQSSQMDLIEYCKQIINERRKFPKDDLISRLILLEEGTNQLTELELYAMCVQLFVAGQETTTNLIGNGLLALLETPKELQKLNNDIGLLENSIEELLRYDSPVQRTVRVAIDDIQIRGELIRKGQSVILMFGSANRDPEQFKNPDSLILDRKPNHHLAFGRGPHFCIGAPLARLEAKIAFESLIRKFSKFELAESDLKWVPSMAMRGLISLKVEFLSRE